MARRWIERDHPRHPGGSEQGGRFRERVGSGGWAARLNSMLGGRRGSTEYQVRRAGGRSDLGDTSDEDLRRAIAESDMDAADEQMRRDLLDEANAEFGGEAELERGFAEAGRQLAEGGNFGQSGRLTGEDVRQALAPERDRAVHDAYNSIVLDEAAEFLEGEEGEEDFDEDLNAQIQIAIDARNRGNKEDWDFAIDHLRRMLTLGYMDEDELPPLPPGRRSGTSGIWLVDLPGEDADELRQNRFWGRENDGGYSVEAEWSDTDADFATVTNPDVGGFTSPQALAVRLEGLGDPDRARAVLGRLTPGQQAGIATHMKAPVHPDDEMTQGIIDKLFPEQYRARLRGLTGQEVADALAPRRTSKQKAAEAFGPVGSRAYMTALASTHPVSLSELGAEPEVVRAGDLRQLWESGQGLDGFEFYDFHLEIWRPGYFDGPILMLDEGIGDEPTEAGEHVLARRVGGGRG